MTDELAADAHADRLDAIAHAQWELLLETDPHRVKIDGLTPHQVQQYLAWHKARVKALNVTRASLDRARYVLGLPDVDRPSLRTAIDHHTTMICQLKAALPVSQQGAGKALKPQPSSTTDRAAEVARYARTHGITVRQAADILNTRKATR